MALHARPAAAEEAQAATRSVLGLTAGVGAMAALTSAAVADPLMVVAAPTAVLVALLGRGSITASGYAAMAVWLAFLPHAGGEALLVPLAMALICLAVALGPDRLIRWVRSDFAGREPADAPEAWIEEAPDRYS